jgi:hypothetical protein
MIGGMRFSSTRVQSKSGSANHGRKTTIPTSGCKGNVSRNRITGRWLSSRTWEIQTGQGEYYERT